MNWTGMMAEFAFVLVVSAAFMPICRGWRLLPVLVAGIAVFTGFSGMLRAVFGDLSAASMVAAIWFIVRSVVGFRDRGELSRFFRLIFITALPLYFTSLTGIGPDLYALGFGAWWYVVIIGIVGLWAVMLDSWLIGLWLASGLFLTAVDLGESSNVWDSLVDAPAAAVGLITWVVFGVSRLRADGKWCFVERSV